MCTSGICSRGVCVAAKLDAGEACVRTEFNNCNSSRCARDSYPSGDLVCCESDESVYSLVWYDTWGIEYCAGTLDAGSPCDGDAMCSSGICSDFVCRDTKLDAGEACDYKRDRCDEYDCDDCISGRCAKGSYPSGSFVCCASSSDAVWSGRFYGPFCAGIQSSGSLCDIDEICSSGVCSEGVCAGGDSSNTTTAFYLSSRVPRGKPTGGGKYPFLAVVDWDISAHDLDARHDPRVRVSIQTVPVRCVGPILTPRHSRIRT
jgi:hypothetical protein